MKPHDVRAVFLAALIASTATIAAQPQAIAVQGGGDALRLAVQAAPSGSVLLVAPGTYEPFEVVAKSLTIVAPQRATLKYPDGLPAPSNFDDPAFTRVSAGSARIVGFDALNSVSVASTMTAGAFIVDDSDFLIEDCTASSMLVLGGSTGGILRSSAIHSTTAFPAWGLLVDQSDVFTSDSQFLGSAGLSPVGPFTLPGISSNFSTLRAERIQAIGGDPGIIGDSEHAVVIVGGTATIQDSIVISTRHGVQVNGAVANISNTPHPLGYDVSANSTLTTTQLPTGALSGVTVGQPTSVDFTATPNAPIAVFFSWGQPRSSVNPLLGEPVYLFATPQQFHLTGGMTDAQGDFALGITLPNVPEIAFEMVWFTALSVQGSLVHSSVPVGGVVR